MKRILVVDDNIAHLTLITGILSPYYKVYPVDSCDVALQLLEKQQPDLILLDIEMPVMNGIDFFKHIKSDKRVCEVPVIFLTHMTDIDNETRAFELGAVDYIHKPFNGAVLIARVRLHLELQDHRHYLEKLVAERSSQIIRLQQITLNLLGTVNEFRDSDTSLHLKRTAQYVTAIMDAMLKRPLPPGYDISQSYYEDIKKSTPLHDIGKISIPDAILLKPDKLTRDEFEIMKTHVANGAKLLRKAIDEYSSPSFLDTALELVLTHHEKWDGTGYPAGLAGLAIPLSGRIMAVADIYDALTSARPYKSVYSHETAISLIKQSSGNHLDPILVEIFLSIQDEVLAILNNEVL